MPDAARARRGLGRDLRQRAVGIEQLPQRVELATAGGHRIAHRDQRVNDVEDVAAAAELFGRNAQPPA